MAVDDYAEELASLFERRDEAALNRLNFWGGVDGLAQKLGSHLKNGISQQEIDGNFEERKTKYGVNRFPARPSKSFFTLFGEALQDKTLIILIFSAIFSIILGVFWEEKRHGWIEGAAIIVSVVVVAGVTAINDYSKERQFRKLSAVNDDKMIKVLRAGAQTVISIFDVLVGDVVLLEVGDQICADGIAIDQDDLKCDESSFTWENEEVSKQVPPPLDPIKGAIDPRTPDPWLLCGCKVVEGRGKMLVLAVGELTQWGKIKAQILQESEPTPLQQNLADLAESIGKMGLVAAGFTFITLFVQWLSRKQHDPHFSISDLSEIIDFMISSITMVVVAVPEGLPLSVTLALAFSMFRMMKDNNLVRHLEACETMGGATCICSDKTGTLTENKMTVVKSWIAGKGFSMFPAQGTFDKSVISRLVESVAFNSTAYFVDTATGKDAIGSKTECALLDFLDAGGFRYSELRKLGTVKKMWPFSSAKKVMVTAMEKQNGRYVIHYKGASEQILAMCNQTLDETGRPSQPPGWKVQAETNIVQMAESGLRTIALAYTEIEDRKDWTDFPNTNLVLIGIFGITDPVRKDVPLAVTSCQSAGITVRMITGDNLLTANHIARECGILNDDGISVEGPTFREMSDEELDKIIPRLQVMARASPQDKLRLVKRLKHRGEVVAVTGDGTNDAPQLQAADVGFSMGIAGTEVAKEASDIVLLDDNFSSIVKGVIWGRNVYDSIRKFVQFQVTVNIVAVVIAFVGAVANGESPLKPVQMLWVNLIMDTMAALALATEAPTPELLKRRPYGRFEPIITSLMWRNIIGQAFFQILVLFVLLYQTHAIPQLGFPSDPLSWNSRDHTVHATVVFNTFVFCQIFNEFNARKLGNEFNVLRGVFSNRLFVAIMVFTAGVQYLIVQYGGEFTQTSPLTPKQWLFCVTLGGFSIPWGAFLRLIPVSTATAPEEPEQNVEIRPSKLRLSAQNVMRANSVVAGFRRRMKVNAM